MVLGMVPVNRMEFEGSKLEMEIEVKERSEGFNKELANPFCCNRELGTGFHIENTGGEGVWDKEKEGEEYNKPVVPKIIALELS